jgi:hypothetical protein
MATCAKQHCGINKDKFTASEKIFAASSKFHYTVNGKRMKASHRMPSGEK